MTTATTERTPKPPTPSCCEPSAAPPMLVPPSEVEVGDLMLAVHGDLCYVLEVPGDRPGVTHENPDGAVYARFVVEHGTFPGGQGDVYVRTDGLVAIRRYVSGLAAETLTAAQVLAGAGTEWETGAEAAVRYVRALEAIAERHLGRLPERGDEDTPEDGNG